MRVADLYPSLVAAYPDLVFHPFEPADLDGVDVAFLALPHGQSQRHAGALVDRVSHLVDIGADFRLPAAAYEQWYGEAHAAPELIDRFVFGLPELFRKDITGSAHVANPGCYPTAASPGPGAAAGRRPGRARRSHRRRRLRCVRPGPGALGSEPLQRGQRERLRLRAPDAPPHGGDGAGPRPPQCLGEASVLFTPHLVPMTRGILATCYARPTAEGAALGTDGLLATTATSTPGSRSSPCSTSRRPPRPPPGATPST